MLAAALVRALLLGVPEGVEVTTASLMTLERESSISIDFSISVKINIDKKTISGDSA